MKAFRLMMILVLLVCAGSVWAAVADFAGAYTFVSRTIDGKPDMEGWGGTMEVKATTLSRHYSSADGTQTKFYDGTVTQEGDIYVVTFTASHKPDYVGKVYRNHFALKDGTFTLTSEDGKFVEVWKKK